MVIFNCIENWVHSLQFFLILFIDNISGYPSSSGNIGACRFGLVTSNADL